MDILCARGVTSVHRISRYGRPFVHTRLSVAHGVDGLESAVCGGELLLCAVTAKQFEDLHSLRCGAVEILTTCPIGDKTRTSFCSDA